MSILGKWFGFAKDEIYGEGINALSRGDYALALEAFEACLVVLKDNSQAGQIRLAQCTCHEQLGRECLRARRYEEALSHFEEALKIHPGFADLNYRAGLCSLALGDRDRASFYVARARSQNMKFVNASILAAIMWPSGIDRNEVSSWTVTQLKGQPHDPHLDEAIRILREKGSQEAIAYVLKMEEEQPLDHVLHMKLGDALVRENKMIEAVQEYTTAVHLAPNYADLRYRLGRALACCNRIDEAIQQLRTSLSLNPMYVDARAALAEIESMPREAMSAPRKTLDGLAPLMAILHRPIRIPAALGSSHSVR